MTLNGKRWNIPDYDITSILHQRGKVVNSINTVKDTFVNLINSKSRKQKFTTDDLFSFFHDKKNREMIRGQILGDLDLTFEDNLVLRQDQQHMNYYSKTFEWYVAEILKREFAFLSSGYGIKVEHSPNGGDFDVLGMSHFDFLYIECKSGKPKNLDDNDIAHFLERSKFINATISIFYIDYKGIHKEYQFNIERFRYIIAGGKPEKVWSFRNKKRCSIVMRTSHHPVYIVDSNTSEETVSDNIRSVLDIHHSIEAIRGTRLNTDFFRVESRGYDVSEVSD